MLKNWWAPPPEPTNYEIVLNLFFRTFRVFKNLVYQSLMYHTLETITFVLTVTILVLAYKLTKGRPLTFIQTTNPQTSLSNTATTAATQQASVNIVNAMHYPNTKQPARIELGDPTPVLERPQRFTGATDVQNWLMALEVYLGQFKKKHWAKATINLIDLNALKQISDINKFIRDEVDGYKNLKAEILKKFVKNNIEKNPNISYKSLLNQKQSDKQTPEEFGRELVKTAKAVFPDYESSHLDSQLQDMFVTGLQDPYLREKVRGKILKQRNKNEMFSINDLISFAEIKHKAMSELSSESSGQGIQIDPYTQQQWDLYYSSEDYPAQNNSKKQHFFTGSNQQNGGYKQHKQQTSYRQNSDQKQNQTQTTSPKQQTADQQQPITTSQKQ